MHELSFLLTFFAVFSGSKSFGIQHILFVLFYVASFVNFGLLIWITSGKYYLYIVPIIFFVVGALAKFNLNLLINQYLVCLAYASNSYLACSF
jgi:hypothetical protein